MDFSVSFHALGSAFALLPNISQWRETLQLFRGAPVQNAGDVGDRYELESNTIESFWRCFTLIHSIQYIHNIYIIYTMGSVLSWPCFVHTVSIELWHPALRTTVTQLSLEPQVLSLSLLCRCLLKQFAECFPACAPQPFRNDATTTQNYPFENWHNSIH